ncbi:hypothetical protein AVEN_215525-1 [Araneus ventricosus]|uniref:Uncharacterized protein n=1 Tax=Araneus ventricosus TaxID=182803 RepID=A0A4Y2BI07_ARAVE|nr:hypothetical protein AVEN_215525-1 [Araneus ventricosus]
MWPTFGARIDEKIRKKITITYLKLFAESNTISDETVEEWINERLRELTRKYEPRIEKLLVSGGDTICPCRCSIKLKVHGGLVVRSRLCDRKDPGSRPDSTEDPQCMGPVAC